MVLRPLRGVVAPWRSEMAKTFGTFDKCGYFGLAALPLRLLRAVLRTCSAFFRRLPLSSEMAKPLGTVAKFDLALPG